MVSGQAPNADTQADCQIYTDMLPGTATSDGQVIGQGCVYPAGTTQTVISRLEGGAVTPTLPLLHRLAGALEGELNLKITGTSTHAEFPLAS